MSDYCYILELQQRFGRGEGAVGIIEWVAPWLEILLGAQSVAGDGGVMLPGDWLDAISLDP